MSRDINFDSPALDINVHFKGGGLGDQIARLPALKYVLDHATNTRRFYLICPEYFMEVAKHLLKPYESKITYIAEEDAKSIANYKLNALTTDEGHHTTMRTHLTDHAFHTIADAEVDVKFKDYLQIRPDELDVSHLNLPPEYVVVTTGYTALVRQWLPAQVNDVIDHIKSKGLRIVFLGKEQVANGLYGNFRTDAVNYQLGINLINRTTLLDAAVVMAGAKAVVGLDNGLIHLAACSQVPIVAGYTSVNPKIRMPYRNGKLGDRTFTVEPDASLSCRYCQSSCYLNFTHKFTECYYKDYKCLVQLRSEKWIKALDEALLLK